MTPSGVFLLHLLTIDISAEISIQTMVKDMFTVKQLDKKFLLTTAEQYHLRFAKTLQKVKDNLQVSLLEMSSTHILDYLYGVDCLMETEDEEGNTIVVAIDVTTNINKLLDKQEKMNQGWRKKLLQAIGVDMCVIVLWEKEETYSQMEKEDQYELASHLLNLVDKARFANRWVDELILS